MEDLEYKVVHHHHYKPADCIPVFEAKVNALLREGWKPLGGVKKDEQGMYQAMVRSVAVVSAPSKPPSLSQ
ncbi:MAG: hypothetical protein K0Q55_2683 [Verrucomicrobia bacterium]|jgi:hypothetical protein|nr:hypothetical protein [Verrucomicrobiota bacterium]